MAFKLKNKQIKEIVSQLRTASKTHAKQADKIESAMQYASGWGVRCTRNPRKYLKK